MEFANFLDLSPEHFQVRGVVLPLKLSPSSSDLPAQPLEVNIQARHGSRVFLVINLAEAPVGRS